jgi:hypothetical protein
MTVFDSVIIDCKYITFYFIMHGAILPRICQICFSAYSMLLMRVKAVELSIREPTVL